jgi:NitT/TauT family transport system substrate-binding protein
MRTAAEIMGKGTAYSTEDALFAINKARLVTHGDNLNFFNLNNGYRGVTGEDLYTEMGKRFAELGFAPAVRPRWQSVAYTGAAKAAQLSGAMHAAESAPDFKPASEADKTATAIASKPVSISFNSGQFQLTENAKTIIDIQFADLAKSFGNARVRIEGNTDNVGSRQMNLNLSKKRAESVAKYLESAYGMNPNKFVIVGNGPDKPVKGCETNATEACKAQNRRTEFQLIEG